MDDDRSRSDHRSPNYHNRNRGRAILRSHHMLRMDNHIGHIHIDARSIRYSTC